MGPTPRKWYQPHTGQKAPISYRDKCWEDGATRRVERQAPTSHQDERHRPHTRMKATDTGDLTNGPDFIPGPTLWRRHRPDTWTTATNLADSMTATDLSPGQQGPTKHRDTRANLTPGPQGPTWHRDNRDKPNNVTQVTDRIRGQGNARTKWSLTPLYRRHWSEGILRIWIKDTCMIVRSANQETSRHWGKSQGIEHDKRLRRKLSEMTVTDGEAGLTQERNKELTSKSAPFDLTPLSRNSQTSNWP